MENYTPKKSPTTQSVTGGAGDFSLGVLEKNADNSVRERETLMSRYNDKKKKTSKEKINAALVVPAPSTDYQGRVAIFELWLPRGVLPSKDLEM